MCPGSGSFRPAACFCMGSLTEAKTFLDLVHTKTFATGGDIDETQQKMCSSHLKRAQARCFAAVASGLSLQASVQLEAIEQSGPLRHAKASP